MNLTLYKNFSVYNKINKNITTIANFPGEQMVESINDNDISVRFTGGTDVSLDNCNYFAWDGAYYFVESIEYEAQNIKIINGTLDLLMTYKDAIMQLNVRATRSTNLGTGRAEDTERLYSVDADKSVISFPRSISGDESQGCYVLVTSQQGFD